LALPQLPSQTLLASVQHPPLIYQETVGISIYKLFSISRMIDSVEVSQGRVQAAFLHDRDLSAACGLQSLQKWRSLS
jgi:hypothetical protein